jgi:cytochrome c oxidase subunit I
VSTVSAAPVELPAEQARGVWSWITTTDHKRIGLLYISTALVFFVVAAAFAMLMRAQLMVPDGALLSPERYNQIFTMHGTTMVFLFGMPILAGLANYLVPLMIGARDMVFPRLNALGYWLFLAGGLFLYSSFLFGGAADTGWFSYAPLTEKPFAPSLGVTFWTISITVLGASSLAGGVNLIITMMKLRTPGMTLLRMPLFAITTFINQFLILFAIPSLTAAVIMLYFDRQYGTVFFKAAEGGDPIVWQHLFWFFGHPEVYILILPAFGIMSELVPVFSRKPLYGRTTMIIMVAVIGFLGFLVWAHHMFAVGLPNYFNAIMAATSMLIAIPTGVKIFNWLATMWGGSLRFGPPLLFACGMIAFFTIGGITGVTLAVVPFDWQVTDTYYVVGHLHNVLFAGTVFAVFGGLYYWFPKMTGRFLDERVGRLHFWVTLVGFGLTFLPMYALGMMGMPRRVYSYAPDVGWNGLNLVSSVGGFIIGVSILILLANVVRSLVAGKRAGDDPWDAWTLEWATTSPPPPENFTSLPYVTSERPLWDVKHPELTERHIPEDIPAAHAPAPPEETARPAVHEPEPPAQTALPVLVALIVAVISAGLLGAPAVIVIGAAATLAVMYLWMVAPWPAPEAPAHPGERFAAVPLGMLVFLISEVVLFGSLIYAYIDARYRLLEWPPPGMPHLEVILPTINTDVLIASGITMEIALMRFKRGRFAQFRLFLVATIVLGVLFLIGQGWEYVHAGFGLSDGIMASTFFVLTGLHGGHVTVGLLVLGYALVNAQRRRRAQAAGAGSGIQLLQAGTYYWHFVDAVWVVLFIILYLF